MLWYFIFIGVYEIIEHYMATWRYEISLLVLKIYFTSELIFQHSKRNFVSPHDHEIPSINYHTCSQDTKHHNYHLLQLFPSTEECLPKDHVLFSLSHIHISLYTGGRTLCSSSSKDSWPCERLIVKQKDKIISFISVTVRVNITCRFCLFWEVNLRAKVSFVTKSLVSLVSWFVLHTATPMTS